MSSSVSPTVVCRFCIIHKLLSIPEQTWRHRFFIVFVCFPDCQFYFYVSSCVYFTFSTIAMSLLLSHDLHVRLLGLHVVQ